MMLSKSANRSSESVLLCLLLVSICLATWAARRGWDFIDGGTYYLSYKYPADVVDLQTSYHLLAGWLFRSLGENIFYFRLLSWLLVGIAVWIFGRGFSSHLRAIWQDDTALRAGRACSLFVMLAGLAPFISAPAALTYNSLNAVCLFIALGLLLSSTGRVLKSGRQTWKGWLEMGGSCFVAGFDVAVKPTTSLFLLGAIMTFCLLSTAFGPKFKAQVIALFLAFGILGVASIAVFLGSWSSLTQRLTNLLNISQNTAYKSALLARTAGEFRDLGRFLCSDLEPAVAVLALGFVAVAVVRRKRGDTRWLARFTCILAGAAWLAVTVHEQFWQGGHLYYSRAAIARFYLEAIALCGSASALLDFAEHSEQEPRQLIRGIKPHAAILCLMLIALPFAGSFGTTNPIYLNAAFQAPCWAAALSILLISASRRCGSSVVASIVLLPLGAMATAQFINGHVLHPYALRTNLFEQNTSTSIGSPATELLLDAPTSAFISDTRKILEANGFKPGDDIFAFFNLPGLVFAVGGRSPIIPWYFGRIYGGDTIEESYMNMAGDIRRQHAWIITQADVTVFRDHFRRGGLDFPDGYSVVGELTNPVNGLAIRIWKRRTPAI